MKFETEAKLRDILKPFLDEGGSLDPKQCTQETIRALEQDVSFVLSQEISRFPEKHKHALVRDWYLHCHPDKTFLDYNFKDQLLISANCMSLIDQILAFKPIVLSEQGIKIDKKNQGYFFRLLKEAEQKKSNPNVPLILFAGLLKLVGMIVIVPIVGLFHMLMVSLLNKFSKMSTQRMIKMEKTNHPAWYPEYFKEIYRPYLLIREDNTSRNLIFAFIKRIIAWALLVGGTISFASKQTTREMITNHMADYSKERQSWPGDQYPMDDPSEEQKPQRFHFFQNAPFVGFYWNKVKPLMKPVENPNPSNRITTATRRPSLRMELYDQD